MRGDTRELGQTRVAAGAHKVQCATLAKNAERDPEQVSGAGARTRGLYGSMARACIRRYSSGRNRHEASSGLEEEHCTVKHLQGVCENVGDLGNRAARPTLLPFRLYALVCTRDPRSVWRGVTQ